MEKYYGVGVHERLGSGPCLYISLVMDAWEPGGRLGIFGGDTPNHVTTEQLSGAGDGWARVGVALCTLGL